MTDTENSADREFMDELDRRSRFGKRRTRQLANDARSFGNCRIALSALSSIASLLLSKKTTNSSAVMPGGGLPRSPFSRLRVITIGQIWVEVFTFRPPGTEPHG